MKKNDFTSFTLQCPWIFNPKSRFIFSNENNLSLGIFEYENPKLFELLRKARLLNFQVDDQHYRLYSWDTKAGESCGWLTKMELIRKEDFPLSKTHKIIAEKLGGITFTYNSDDNFLTNSQSLFSPSICQQGIGDAWSAFYLQRRKEDNGSPLEHDAWIVFGKEASGHYTLYDQQDRVYMFNTDPGESYLEEIDGQPSATFFRIKNAHTLKEYVELLAQQWLDWVR